MKRKYFILLGGTVLMFVLVHILSPRQINWLPTFSARDKNPFGSFVMHALLNDIFPNQTITTNNLTFYELADSTLAHNNIFALAVEMNLGAEDTRALLANVSEGAHAFLSANYFKGLLNDTLGLYMQDVLFKHNRLNLDRLQDSSYLRFTNGLTNRNFHYRLNDMFTFFDKTDSLKKGAFVVSRNQFNDPVTLRIPWGDGQLIINSTPHAFTNNYLLYKNHRFVAQTLSYLPVQPIVWTEYYQMGRMESPSPIRVILSVEPLAWAYYLTLSALLIFIVFEAKRKQRIIPIIKQLPNTSLEFIRTIGNMYIQTNNHKSIAEKRIAYFFEHIRSAYYLPSDQHEEFVKILAKKSGNTEEDTQSLVALIKVIQRSGSVSQPMLLDLNNQLEKFNHQK